jgi:hypothetical protein
MKKGLSKLLAGVRNVSFLSTYNFLTSLSSIIIAEVAIKGK